MGDNWSDGFTANYNTKTIELWINCQNGQTGNYQTHMLIGPAPKQKCNICDRKKLVGEKLLLFSQIPHGKIMVTEITKLTGNKVIDPKVKAKATAKAHPAANKAF